MSSALVEVQNLGWKAGQRTILSDITFKIDTGTFVGLIGPNGSGKSSLMRCMYRVNQPCNGRVLINGEDVWQLSPKRAAQRTAVIVQEIGAALELSVWEFVAQGLTPHKGWFEGDSLEDRVRQQRLMERFELSEFARVSFANLSGGEKQRALLARALMQRPEFLIMDEPTNHLDVHHQIESLKQVKALGLTVFASFHDLNLAAAFCDNLIVLDQGRIVEHGSPEKVLTEDLISHVFRACCVVDRHPLHSHPRVSYAYHD